MKNLVLIITLIFSLTGFAGEMPKYLEGATVTVTLKNGKTYTYKSEEYAVVKRANMSKNIYAAAEVKQARKIIKKVEKGELVKQKKNRVYILGGYGSTGKLETSTNGSRYETKHEKGAVGGVGYQRKVNEKLNLGIQVQTNGTTSLSIGTDF